MFGMSQKEKREKLSRKIAQDLRLLVLHVMEDGEVPTNVKFSLYVVGCLTKICYNYHYMGVNGKTDERESTAFAADTVSIVLQSDANSIKNLLFLGLGNKEPALLEGMEDGGKYIDSLPHSQREPLDRIRKRIEGIANSYGFE